MYKGTLNANTLIVQKKHVILFKNNISQVKSFKSHIRRAAILLLIVLYYPCTSMYALDIRAAHTCQVCQCNCSLYVNLSLLFSIAIRTDNLYSIQVYSVRTAFTNKRNVDNVLKRALKRLKKSIPNPHGE
jgi:hypothetical protein